MGSTLKSCCCNPRFTESKFLGGIAASHDQFFPPFPYDNDEPITVYDEDDIPDPVIPDAQYYDASGGGRRLATNIWPYVTHYLKSVTVETLSLPDDNPGNGSITETYIGNPHLGLGYMTSPESGSIPLGDVYYHDIEIVNPDNTISTSDKGAFVSFTYSKTEKTTVYEYGSRSEILSDGITFADTQANADAVLAALLEQNPDFYGNVTFDGYDSTVLCPALSPFSSIGSPVSYDLKFPSRGANYSKLVAAACVDQEWWFNPIEEEWQRRWDGVEWDGERLWLRPITSADTTNWARWGGNSGSFAEVAHRGWPVDTGLRSYDATYIGRVAIEKTSIISSKTLYSFKFEHCDATTQDIPADGVIAPAPSGIETSTEVSQPIIVSPGYFYFDGGVPVPARPGSIVIEPGEGLEGNGVYRTSGSACPP